MKNSIRWHVQLKIFKMTQFWQFHPLILHGFYQKWPKIDPMILLHHLKQLTLSFQKNIKFLKSDTPNKSYYYSKIPSTCDIEIHCVCNNVSLTKAFLHIESYSNNGFTTLHSILSIWIHCTAQLSSQYNTRYSITCVKTSSITLWAKLLQYTTQTALLWVDCNPQWWNSTLLLLQDSSSFGHSHSLQSPAVF